MTWTSQLSNACYRLCVIGALLSVVGCASTQYRTPDNGVDVPDYVRNLPKSRTGNMAEYTVFGKRYRTMDSAANFTEQGIASWYGKKFHGRKTSSGEIYDMYAMTAAHKHLPLPTYVRVTNTENNQSVVVKVNDRGPFVGDRIIDMSFAAAQQLGMAEQGTANVRVDALSTHLVAANSNASNLTVAKAFAPAVIEPELAAVPLPSPAAALPLDEVQVDGTEDGFVELSSLGGEQIPEPAETQAMAEAPTVRRSVQTAGNYFIQLGAFSNTTNAQALVDDVAQQTGLPAFVEKDGAQQLFRVKMGPFQQGAALDNTLNELATLGIDGYTKLASAH